MKKLLMLIAVVAMALVIVPAAFAGNGNGQGGGAGSKATVVNYSLSGTVTAVDAEAGAITVTIVKANKAARAYKGKTVTLNVAATTLLNERTADGDLVAATIADFAAGDRVTSTGRLDRTDAAAPIFTAKRVTIALPLGTCLVP